MLEVLAFADGFRIFLSFLLVFLPDGVKLFQECAKVRTMQDKELLCFLIQQ